MRAPRRAPPNAGYEREEHRVRPVNRYVDSEVGRR